MSTASSHPKAEEIWLGIFVLLALVGAIVYGVYLGCLWLFRFFGPDGLACILAGIDVMWITAGGVLYLTYRWTNERAKGLSPREAVRERPLYIAAFIGLPAISAILVLSIPLATAYPGDHIVVAIILVASLFYGLALRMWFDTFAGKHTAYNPKLFCPHCSRLVKTDVFWVCGDCSHRNDKIRAHSFLQHCESCGSFPRTYHCPHPGCGQLVYLGYPRRGRPCHYPAQKWVEPPPVQAEETEEARVQRQQEETEKLQHEITIARLNSELATLLNQQRVHAGNSRERREESLRTFKALHADIHEIAERERQWAKQEFGTNSKAKKRHEHLISAWVEDQLAKCEDEYQ